jgi:hypothetical protein
MANFEFIPLVFLLVMIYLTFFAYKRKQIQKYGLVFWMTLWIIGIAAVIFHPIVNKLLDPLSITRVFDLYTIVSFFIIMFICFYLFRATQRLENKIEILTRTIALKPIKGKKKI